jgi:outer membrane protein
MTTLATARTQLAHAIGDMSNVDLDAADEELAPIPVEDLGTETLTTQALRDRPEVAALEQQRESQRLTVKALRGSYAPALSATGSYQEIGTALDSLGPSWSVGVGLAWPLFQGGLTVAQVREGEANLDATTAQLEVERLQVRLDVEQAKLSLIAAKATVLATVDVVTNAAERLRLAEGRYTQGVGSIIELGDAQVAMTQANAQLVQARYNVATARATLLSTLGRR